MSTVDLLLIAAGGVLVLIILALLGRRAPLPRRLDRQRFADRWGQLLTRVKTNEGMMLAVIDADKLLDEALRKRHFKGKTTGERMVAAQRTFTDNDAVWYAHKLRNRLVHEPDVRLRKREAMNALEGFKKGLKDLGAL